MSVRVVLVRPNGRVTVAQQPPQRRVIVADGTAPRVIIKAPSRSAVVVARPTRIVIRQPGIQGRPGPAGADSTTTVEKVAAHNLSGHRAVTTRSDGKVEYASNTDLDHAGGALFLTTAAAATGDTVIVQLLGEITEPGWSWTPGPIWLATNGQLTQTPPVVPARFSRQVGAATSPTTLLWHPGATYLLTP